MNAGKGTFRHAPLTQPDEIRLVQVRVDGPTKSIACEFSHHSLQHLPPYATLSYAWGDSTVTRTLSCGNGTTLEVTENLASWLQNWSPEVSKKYQLLWVDALCIDQGNVEERNHQVRLMKRIYKSASSLNVWLGDEADDSDRGCELVATLANYIRSYGPRTSITRKTLDDIGGSYESWLALIKIFDRSWFERIWVQQEIMASSSIHIQCGGKLMEWEDIWCIPASIHMRGSVSILLDVMIPEKRERLPSGFARVFGMMRWKARQECDLFMQEILVESRDCKATDPRDKVFALLSIASDAEAPSLDPQYGLSVEEVYRATTAYLLCRCDRIDILYNAGYAKVRLDLPSWVQDWSYPRGIGGLAQYSQAGYQAAGKSKPRVRKCKDPNLLFISGVEFDTIEQLSSTRRLESQTRMTKSSLDWVSESLTLASSLSNDYPTCNESPEATTSRTEAYWRTMVANKSHLGLPAPDKFAVEFAVFVGVNEMVRHFSLLSVTEGATISPHVRVETSGEEPTNSNPLTGVGPSTTFSQATDSATINQRFCITKDGYMGLVPDVATPGDIIAVFLGGVVPFVLRPISGDEGDNKWEKRYLLVGECYVHGVMNGEVLTGNEEVVEFALR